MKVYILSEGTRVEDERVRERVVAVYRNWDDALTELKRVLPEPEFDDAEFAVWEDELAIVESESFYNIIRTQEVI